MPFNPEDDGPNHTPVPLNPMPPIVNQSNPAPLTTSVPPKAHTNIHIAPIRKPLNPPPTKHFNPAMNLQAQEVINSPSHYVSEQENDGRHAAIPPEPPPAPSFQNNVPAPPHFSPALLIQFTHAPSITNLKPPPLTPSCSPITSRIPLIQCSHPTYAVNPSIVANINKQVRREAVQNEVHTAPHSFTAEEMAKAAKATPPEHTLLPIQGAPAKPTTKAAEIPPEPPPLRLDQHHQIR